MLLSSIERALSARESLRSPDDGAPARAAVTLIFRAGDGGHLDLLLIRRADREGDPWSGQIALPGGRASPDDESLEATAVRETLEETGIDLARHGRVLGSLDDLRPRTAVLPPIIVTPFVAALGGEIVRPLVLSNEVAEAFWVPWNTLADPATTRESELVVLGTTWRGPAFVLGPRVVWGMTERILRQLLARVG